MGVLFMVNLAGFAVDPGALPGALCQAEINTQEDTHSVGVA